MIIRKCWIIISVLFFVTFSHAGQDRNVYLEAQKAAKSGQKDFVFMRYRALLRDYPKSQYRKEAIFALGEYYFFFPDYTKAGQKFQDFMTEFPDAEEKIIVLAYLFKLAKKDEDASRVAELKSEIVHLRQVSLLFQDYEEYNYQSPLNHHYQALFHIDRIEFYVEGKLFEEVVF